MQHGVSRLDGVRIGGCVFAGVEVAIEAREVAAAYFQADAVPFEKHIAGVPHVDFELVDLARSHEFGRAFGRFAKFGAENAFGHIARETVRAYIDELGGEVSVYSRRFREQIKRDRATSSDSAPVEYTSTSWRASTSF